MDLIRIATVLSLVNFFSHHSGQVSLTVGPGQPSDAPNGRQYTLKVL